MPHARAKPTAPSTATQALAPAQGRGTGTGNAAAQGRLRAAGEKGRPVGSVSLTLQKQEGAPASPGAFPGLPALHDWLMTNQASLENYRGPLTVNFTANSVVYQHEQLIWAYYHPHQTLVLNGRGAVVSGFPKTGKGPSTDGYFLAYRPIIAQKSMPDATNPTEKVPAAAANFEMRDLTVRGYAAGGVELDPRHGKLPPPETYFDPSYDEEAGHFSGGREAAIAGAVIEGNTFEDMGTKTMAPGRAVWDPTDREGYKRCGWGGIVARGLQASTLANNTFSDLENGEVRKTDGSLANGPGLIHGIYLRDGSSDNTIRGNTLSDISGAAIKFTNGADRNKVRRNRASNTGSDTLVLDHYNPAPSDGRAPEADSRGYDNDRIGRAADGARYIQDNIEGDAYGGSTKRLREFVEKRVEERKKS